MRTTGPLDRGANAEDAVRSSPIPFVLFLTVLALMLSVLDSGQTSAALSAAMRSLALFCYALAGGVALLYARWARAARVALILGCAALMWLASVRLQTPAALGLFGLPVVLAIGLLGLRAGAAVAALVTVLALLLAGELQPGSGAGVAVGVALTGIWGTLVAASTMRRAFAERLDWLLGYFEQARQAVEEAQDRRGELEQALDDLVHANRQLALANERIQTLRAIAEEAQKAKSVFVSRVSHELRTPLNMILGLTDLMLETPEIYDTRLPPKMREDLRVVQRNCEHLSHMVNDVLDLTRLEDNRIVLHRERVDLARIIESAVTAVRPLLDKKALALTLCLPPGLPAAFCDRTRIEQVTLNLLSNAARYTDCGQVSVEAGLEQDRITVSVTDTGPGIATESLQRIFEPFYQVTGDLWTDRGGSGLGLTISKQLVELHGGRMWVESQPGSGSAFHFDLPVSPPLDPVASPTAQMREEWIWHERRSWARFPDGHYMPRAVVCDRTGEVYSVLAHSADEAELVHVRDVTGLASELKESPAHAVVVNAGAGDDPWALVAAARATAVATPVILCSVPLSIQRSLATGVRGYLVKPVTRAQLAGTIESLGQAVRRVLVVDDDSDARKLFTQLLLACDGGLQVDTAAGGDEALARVRARRPDLVLLDIVLPGMDGREIAAALLREDASLAIYYLSAQDAFDQPPASPFLLVSMDQPIPLSKVLPCSLAVSKLLLAPGPSPAPVRPDPAQR